MQLSRREFAAWAASAALAFRVGRAAAADPSVFVSWMDIPATLDPAQTLDLQATQWAHTTAAQWETDLTGIVNNIKTKWPMVKRIELMASTSAPGNMPSIDEYLRRQALSAEQYQAFMAGLRKKFPNQPFLIVSYGDHQPEFSPHILDPDLDEGGVGTNVIQENQTTGQRVMVFVAGPIFTNVLLADEINRTPPKTQAALLQAMQEKEVTAGGKTYRL